MVADKKRREEKRRVGEGMPSLIRDAGFSGRGNDCTCDLPLKACRVFAYSVAVQIVKLYIFTVEILPRPLKYGVITLRINTDTLCSSSIAYLDVEGEKGRIEQVV